MIWNPDLLPKSLYEERLTGVRKEMADRHVDALLIYGDVQQHGSLTWLTNFLPRVRDAFLIIEREDNGNGVLFVSVSARDIPFARSISYTGDVRSFDQLEPEATDYLQMLQQKNARFGFVNVTQQMPLELWERLFPETSAEPDYEDVTEWLNGLRFRKTDEERYLVRNAAEISNQAIQFLISIDWSHRAGGIGEVEIAAELENYCIRQGAEDVRVLISAGRDGNPAFTRGERMVQKDDHVAVYLAIQWHRYWAEIGRTLKFSGDKLEVVESGASREVNRILMDLSARSGMIKHTDLEEVSNRHKIESGFSIFPICEGIGIDPTEVALSTGGYFDLQGSTLVIRWGGYCAEGLQFHAETIEIQSGGLAVLTQNT